MVNYRFIFHKSKLQGKNYVLTHVKVIKVISKVMNNAHARRNGWWNIGTNGDCKCCSLLVRWHLFLLYLVAGMTRTSWSVNQPWHHGYGFHKNLILPPHRGALQSALCGVWVANKWNGWYKWFRPGYNRRQICLKTTKARFENLLPRSRRHIMSLKRMLLWKGLL